MTFSFRQPDVTAPGRAAIAAGLIVAGSIALGVAGGLVWAAVAPRVLYQVYTLNPPTAYATNPETSAFIAADGWYCLIAVVGGALIGLLGYLFGVRRYGPVPMAGIVIGATAAAFVCRWLGHRQSGGAGFSHVLATSKPGMLLQAPISLGSQGALAFWPLAAAAVAGGIELVGVLRARHQDGYDPAGVGTSGPWRIRAETDQGPDPARLDLSTQPEDGPEEREPGFSPRYGQPAEDPRGHSGGSDHHGGGQGRAAL